ALALAQKGVTTYAADRRGAGASKEPRGHIRHHMQFITDLEELLNNVGQRHPAAKLFIVANCWGGKVALTVASREQKRRIAGIVLTSPAVAVQVDFDLLTKGNIVLDYLFGGGTGYFDIPLTPRQFTDNPAYLQYVE